MTNKIKILISSKAFWSIAGIFIYQGLQGIAPVLGQGHFGQIIQIVLAVLAMYQHPKELTEVAQTGSLGSMRISKY